MKVMAAAGTPDLLLTLREDGEDGVRAWHRHCDSDAVFADGIDGPANRVLSFIAVLPGSALLRQVDVGTLSTRMDEGEVTISLFRNSAAFQGDEGPVEVFVVLCADADGSTVDAALFTDSGCAERAFERWLDGWI